MDPLRVRHVLFKLLNLYNKLGYADRDKLIVQAQGSGGEEMTAKEERRKEQVSNVTRGLVRAQHFSPKWEGRRKTGKLRMCHQRETV